MSEENKKIGGIPARIRIRLATIGWTLKRAAKAAGLHTSQLSGLDSRANISTVYRAAVALGLPLDVLLTSDQAVLGQPAPPEDWEQFIDAERETVGLGSEKFMRDWEEIESLYRAWKG